jgi:hypothetical protein
MWLIEKSFGMGDEKLKALISFYFNREWPTGASSA